MGKIMTNTEFVNKAIDIANNYKTLYIMAAFGAPMSAKNKTRYKNNNAYNKQPARQKMIDNASADTFGFDCVGLIKSILWGWSGNTNLTYGGATYASNGLADMSIPNMVNKNSYDDTQDFSKITKGELVYLSDGGHIGIYIGDGLVVESTPAWKNKVQITACANIGKKDGYPSRKWDWHCKFNFIDYVEETQPEPTPQPTTQWTTGDYKILVPKTLRTSVSLTPTNRCKVKNIDSYTKTLLTSTNPNAIAMFRAGVTVSITLITKDSAGRIWGRYGNIYIVLCNADGTPQAQRV